MLLSADMANVSADLIKIGVLSFVVFLGGILVIVGTVRRNRWGINTAPVNCPRCKQPMSQVRKPKSLSQFMWGGGTCGNCGCEMDKWGRALKRA
jgi:hypothetical protein